MERLLLALVLLYSPLSKAEKWTVATLEWPPFTCEKCPDQGAAARALKDVMKKEGVDVEFEFLPWSRALLEGRAKKYAGVFPIWQETVAPPYVLSPLLFTSPVGFIEPTNKRIPLTKIEDLSGKTVGVVQDYGHLRAFNKLVTEGKIKTQAVLRDELNLKKIYANRIDAALIDINNAKYFLGNQDRNLASNVSISPLVLENKGLYISFNGFDTELKKKKIKAALQKSHFQKSVDDWLNKFMNHL